MLNKVFHINANKVVGGLFSIAMLQGSANSRIVLTPEVCALGSPNSV